MSTRSATKQCVVLTLICVYGGISRNKINRPKIIHGNEIKNDVNFYESKYSHAQTYARTPSIGSLYHFYRYTNDHRRDVFAG